MSLIYDFRGEIEGIKDDKIREFVVEGIALLPEFYGEMKDYIERTQRTLGYAMMFCDALGSDDIAYDIITASVLLQDVTAYEYVDDEIEENTVHPVTARAFLYSLQDIVGVDMFDNILRLIEGSHGFNSPIPQVEPTINDAVHVWILPFANQLARGAIK